MSSTNNKTKPLVSAQRVALRSDGVACHPHSSCPQTVDIDLDLYQKASSITATLADPDDSECTPLKHIVLIGKTIYEKK